MLVRPTCVSGAVPAEHLPHSGRLTKHENTTAHAELRTLAACPSDAPSPVARRRGVGLGDLCQSMLPLGFKDQGHQHPVAAIF